jgi:FO synthase
MEAPLYLKGKSRRGPTFREAILMHAVARLVLHGLVDNIQASWVKMGREGVAACLKAGVNDLGGSLMNESITRAAGSGHGQEWAPQQIEALIAANGRAPRMRTTLYADAPAERRRAAFNAAPLAEVYGAPAAKQQRSKRLPPGTFPKAIRDEVQLLNIQPVPDAALYEQVVLMAACN